MFKLRLVVVTTALMAALFVGGGVASAGMAWCEEGSPPPMDTTLSDGSRMVTAPHSGMPTPLVWVKDQQPEPFTQVNTIGTDQLKPADKEAGKIAYLPPGMAQAAANKK